MDLVELLKRPEGKTLEFKRDLSAPEGALKTIIAFANTAGGTLLVGVEDRSGHVRGVSEPLDLEERLASLISDQVAPRLMPEIEILPWRRTQVLAVRVYPSPRRPHYLKRAGPDGGVYVRVGSTNRRADRELVEELRRFGRGEAFGVHPCLTTGCSFRGAESRGPAGLHGVVGARGGEPDLGRLEDGRPLLPSFMVSARFPDALRALSARMQHIDRPTQVEPLP